jgi:hypothetical protein
MTKLYHGEVEEGITGALAGGALGGYATKSVKGTMLGAKLGSKAQDYFTKKDKKIDETDHISIVDQMTKTQAEIEKIVRSGGRVAINDPLSQKLKMLKNKLHKSKEVNEDSDIMDRIKFLAGTNVDNRELAEDGEQPGAPALTGNKVALSRTQMALLQKLKSAITYTGSNIGYENKVRFTPEDRQQVEQLLKVLHPDSAEGYDIIQRAMKGFESFDPKEKQTVDKVFADLFAQAEPMKVPQGGKQQQGGQQNGQADQAMQQGFQDAFQQGIQGQQPPPPPQGQTPPPPPPGAKPTAAPQSMGQMPAKNMGAVQTAMPRLPGVMPRLREETALTGEYGHTGKLETVQGIDADMMARIKFLAGIRENDTTTDGQEDSNLTAMKSVSSIFIR